MRVGLATVPAIAAMAFVFAVASPTWARPQGDGGGSGGDRSGAGDTQNRGKQDDAEASAPSSTDGDTDADADADADAEPTPKRAEQLFKQGLDEMLAGRYERGCPALAESYRLDPLPGALFTLAECEYKWGRLATAYEHYQGFLSQYERMEEQSKTRQAQRAEVARKQLELIEPDIPTLTIVLPENAPRDTVVQRGDSIVPPASLGQPLRMDPGRHTIRVLVAGDEPREYQVALNRGDDETLNVELAAQSAGDDDDDDAPFRPDGDAMRLAGAIFVGVGVVGAIVGTSAGVATLAHKSTIDDNCNALACNREGLDAADNSKVTGALSTAGVVIGGVGLGVGLTLWLLAPAAVAEGPAQEAPADDRPQSLNWQLTTHLDPLRGEGFLGVDLRF